MDSSLTEDLDEWESTGRAGGFYRAPSFAAWAAFAVLWTILMVQSYQTFSKAQRNLIASSRNFFGVLKIQERPLYDNGPLLRKLLNGRISHGAQILGRTGSTEPITYYARESGVGRALLDRIRPTDGTTSVRATATDSAQPIATALYASLGIVPRVPLLNLIGLPSRPDAFGALPSGVRPIPFERIATDVARTVTTAILEAF